MTDGSFPLVLGTVSMVGDGCSCYWFRFSHPPSTNSTTLNCDIVRRERFEEFVVGGGRKKDRLCTPSGGRGNLGAARAISKL
jgi:hypothetical protein